MNTLPDISILPLEAPHCPGNVFSIISAGIFPCGQHPLRYLNKLLLSVGGKVKLGKAREEVLGQLFYLNAGGKHPGIQLKLPGLAMLCLGDNSSRHQAVKDAYVLWAQPLHLVYQDKPRLIDKQDISQPGRGEGSSHDNDDKKQLAEALDLKAIVYPGSGDESFRVELLMRLPLEEESAELISDMTKVKVRGAMVPPTSLRTEHHHYLPLLAKTDSDNELNIEVISAGVA